MAAKLKSVSIDEYLSNRKDFVGSNGAVSKIASAPSSWNAVDRSARFIMSTEEPDRDKDIIVQSGGDLTNFLKNPQALLFHASWNFPIGTWTDVVKITNGRPKRHEGTLKFLPAGVDEQADRAAAHVEHGSMRTVSIGFIPKAVQRREEDPAGGWPGYMILDWELCECSLVPIPANPGAIAKGAGGNMKIARALIEEILDTWIKLPNGLVAPRKDYEAALAAITGFKTTTSGAGECKDGDEEDDEIPDEAAADDDADGEPADETSDPDDKSGADDDGDGEPAGETPDPDDKMVEGIWSKIAGRLEKAFERLTGGKHEPPPPAKADPELLAKSLARFEALKAETANRLR